MHELELQSSSRLAVIDHRHAALLLLLPVQLQTRTCTSTSSGSGSVRPEEPAVDAHVCSCSMHSSFSEFMLSAAGGRTSVLAVLAVTPHALPACLQK